MQVSLLTANMCSQGFVMKQDVECKWR